MMLEQFSKVVVSVCLPNVKNAVAFVVENVGLLE